MTDITLNKLLPWDGNVRKTGASEALEELIASIASHGLLQSLVVKPASGKKNAGKYHVVAGQRRLMALTELAKRGTIPPDKPVSCHVLPENAQAEEISLAENTVRLQMHPADQFEAFHALHESGTPAADIAARFGVAESTVLKLLKLARVSPKIIAAYREGTLNLAQVQAFASTDDTKQQEAVFADINPDYADADEIREALTPEGDIPATNKRVVYVGLDAYLKAGGKARPELFTETTFLLDAELLNQLAAKKLAKQEKKLLADGWGWVKIDPDMSWDKKNRYGRIHEENVPLPPEQQAEYDRLSAEFEELENAWYEEEGDTERPARLTEIEAMIEELDNRQRAFVPEQKALSGCVVTIDGRGKVEILEGYVRPEDRSRIAALEKAQEANDPDAIAEALSEPQQPEEKGLSASLIEALTEHRSLGLQAQLAVNPDIGLAAAAHSMAHGFFYESGQPCLNTWATKKYHRLAKGSTASDELDREQSLWRDRIPGDETHFWQWCLDQDRDTLIALITFCAAHSIDAMQRKADKPDNARLAHAQLLGKALKLDMCNYFRPDEENYFSKISKDMILADLKEITGKDASPAMLKMKKSDLAKHAAKAVVETHWLPAILRKQDVSES